MTKQTDDSNRNGQKGDPNRDVQPWLGWIAAFLVVVIVVIAVAMGMERTNNQRSNGAEVRMTPLVGGMDVPVATETGNAAIVASNVTPAPISEASTLTMVTVITSTTDDASAVTATGSITQSSDVTPTNTESYTIMLTDVGAVRVHQPITATAEVTATSPVTAEVTSTVVPTATAVTTSTAEAIVMPTSTMTPTVVDTFTPAPSESPTARPKATATATKQATPPSTTTAESFAVGDRVVPSSGRVEIYADSAADAPILDSYGAGAVLEVLDPDGDVDSYPVMIDGQSWLRVRASDGLVGWVKAQQVEVQ